MLYYYSFLNAVKANGLQIALSPNLVVLFTEDKRQFLILFSYELVRMGLNKPLSVQTGPAEKRYKRGREKTEE